MNISDVRKKYIQHFNRIPECFYAPGRVNLMGDHTDYNNGLVLPMAINMGTLIAISKSNNNIISIYSENMDEKFSFDISEMNLKSSPQWVNYIFGITSLLRENEYIINGLDIYISSNLPMGAGLSSSASLSIALCYAIFTIHDFFIDKNQIITLAQLVEHRYVGTKCGIMDQTICTHAKKQKLLQLDCETNHIKQIDFNTNETSILICDTGIKHELCSSEYNIRKNECDEAAALLDIASLRNLSERELEQEKNNLPDTLYKRCLHVVTENNRVKSISDAIELGDWNTAGRVMRDSHYSLKNHYEVSCHELDFLVESSYGIQGIYGGRMTGGGFGGCAVFIIQNDLLPSIKNTLSKLYLERFDRCLKCFSSSAYDGVSKVS